MAFRPRLSPGVALSRQLRRYAWLIRASPPGRAGRPRGLGCRVALLALGALWGGYPGVVQCLEKIRVLRVVTSGPTVG